MCGSPEMESYEEFCLRSRAVLQTEGKFSKTTREPPCATRACSVVSFHGRAVLPPLLNAEQRHEMCDHRWRAMQRERDRRNQRSNEVWNQTEDALDHTQTHEGKEVEKLTVSKCTTLSGYTLVTDSPGLSRDSGLQMSDGPPISSADPPTLIGDKAAEEVKVDREEKSEDEEDISLDSLVKQSREHVKREQSHQHGSNSASVVTPTPPPEPVLETRSPMGDSGVQFGFSLHHSPVGPPQTHIQHHTLYDPIPQQSGPPSLPDQRVRLPSPESSVSPRVQRRRPRPVSTGNIHISFPVSQADLLPHSSGRSEDNVGVWGDAVAGAISSPDHQGAIRSEGSLNGSEARRWSHGGTSPVQEIFRPSAMGHRDHLASAFRRRCHTLDSQLHNYPCGIELVDRSQERVPRFMAGVTWLAPSRRIPTSPLNRPYEVENPSPSVLRSHIAPELTPVKLRMVPDEPRHNGRITPTILGKPAEALEETQRRAQALEDMQRRLEEEHALQMSLLLVEQEKEQQCLRLELEETERRLKAQESARPQGGDVSRWNLRSMNDSCPVVSSSCPRLSPAHSPGPGPSTGFPSPVSSSVSSPSVQPPVYVWGPLLAANKSRARLSLVLTSEQQRALARIGAITRGFLTRRLLRTDKVKHLRQTIVDTQEFIRSFQTEAPQKRGSVSAQDLSLQERVRAQLRAALYDIHEIFFEIPLEERLGLLQQDRELRMERKLRDMEKAKFPKDRGVLSTATQRSLDRKKRVGESPAQTRKMQQKPKSPTTNRVIKSSQGQKSPLPGGLNRQGSWYKKIPEERVKRSDSLKKQHSLG